MFGDTCCTFIRNNTAQEGSVQKALQSLDSLAEELTQISGLMTRLWDDHGGNIRHAPRWQGYNAPTTWVLMKKMNHRNRREMMEKLTYSLILKHI